MTDILGHDVNGRPLRAGDRVRCLLDGDVGTIRGPAAQHDWHPTDRNCLTVDWVSGSDADADDLNLRRIDDRTDHRPSEYTYDELLDRLKTGAPNHAKA